MGQFASTLFRLMLGWVQRVVSALWGMIVSSDGGGGLEWLLAHWFPLLLFLCAAGAIIDFVIYLLRWQPYRVWRAFLQGGRERHAVRRGEEEDPRYQRRWIYADGTTALEDLRTPAEVPGETQLDLPIRPVRRAAGYGGDERAYYQPVYPRQGMHPSADSEGDDE